MVYTDDYFTLYDEAIIKENILKSDFVKEIKKFFDNSKKILEIGLKAEISDVGLAARISVRFKEFAYDADLTIEMELNAKFG